MKPTRGAGAPAAEQPADVAGPPSRDRDADLRHDAAPPRDADRHRDAARPRDAARTRELLLEVASRRFALEGYAATSVRELAADAGVNVALISRYFGSKEGLFETCLQSAASSTRDTAGQVGRLADVGLAIARQVCGTDSGDSRGTPPTSLLLLLRSSGDPGAEQIRLAMLRSMAERLASVAGWAADDPDLLLRAQLVLCTSLGLAIARSWPGGLEPLASADAQTLAAPLEEVVTALLSRRGHP